MNALLTTLKQVDFLTALWLFPAAIILHEAEEWNFRDWYQRHFVDLPPITHASIRTGLALISLVHLLWCGMAVLTGNPTIAAFLYLPGIAFACQNALQHVYWFFYFKRDATGVLTSVFLVLPVGVYLIGKTLYEGHVPVWYVVLLLLVMLPGLLQTVKAGNTMTPPLRKLNALCITLSKRIFS